MITTVRYAGAGERRGPVTMGQANMIRCILRDDPVHINNHDVWPVPPGTTLAAVLDALRALTLRHEALRTTFPDHGEQLVSARGEFSVTVLDHEEFPADAWRYAESVARAARAGRFRLASEYPLRVSVLCLSGEPAFAALAASHAVTDGTALAVLREEWLALLSGCHLPPPTALTPLDLAAEEASAAGQRKSAASLRYWERIIRSGPQAMFAEPRTELTDWHLPQLTLRSERGARALARTAERTGSLPSTVLLGAWCTLVAHRAGQTSCVAAVPTSNRFHPRLARAVGTLAQDALLQLDLRVSGFDGLLRRAWGAALNAYRHSQFDSGRLWEMIGRVTFERGSDFARDVVFNDVSQLPATLVTAADRAEANQGQAAPELDWGPVQVLPTRLLAFAYQTDPLLHLSMWADPALFGRAEAEGFLTGLVRLLEAAAEGDIPLDTLTEVTGVEPPVRDGSWQLIDQCWVSPQAVAEALGKALGGLPVHVDTAGGELTAHIAAGAAPLTPGEAHTALMAALPGHPGLLAPQRYVIVRHAPAAEAAEAPDEAWRRQQILLEGSGRERPPSHDD